MTKSAECEDSEGIISVSSGSLILVQVCKNLPEGSCSWG